MKRILFIIAVLTVVPFLFGMFSVFMLLIGGNLGAIASADETRWRVVNITEILLICEIGWITLLAVLSSHSKLTRGYWFKCEYLEKNK